MRVLIYTEEFPPFTGGIASYANDLAINMAKLGAKVFVLAPDYGGLASIDKADNPKVIRKKQYRGFRLLQNFFALRKNLMILQPDILLSVCYFSQMASALEAVLFKAKTKIAVTIHGSEIFWHLSKRRNLKSYIKYRLLRRLIESSKVIITVSNYTRKLLAEQTQLWGWNCESENTISVVYHGISPTFYKTLDESSADECRMKYGITKKDFIVLSVGRTEYRKGHDLLIRAVRELENEENDIKLIVVGDGPFFNELKLLAGTSANIVLTGSVSHENIAKFFYIADVFALTSRQMESVESFGIVFLEAGIYSLPSIGTSVAGIPEAIVDGKTGFLVQGDVQSIKETILRLKNDQTLCQKMGETARERVLQNFTAEIMAKRTLELLTGQRGNRL